MGLAAQHPLPTPLSALRRVPEDRVSPSGQGFLPQGTCLWKRGASPRATLAAGSSEGEQQGLGQQGTSNLRVVTWEKKR